MDDENREKAAKEASFMPLNHPDLLDELMLDLYIEVGRAKIKISELLKMAEGQIIQLEQKPDDPLIIYANDKEIARGTIISANGKYNIRII